MGKYDIDAKFKNEADLTLNDLCKEILEETGGGSILTLRFCLSLKIHRDQA